MGADIHWSVAQPQGNPNCVAQDCNFKAQGGCSFKTDLSKTNKQTNNNNNKTAHLAVQVLHCTLK